MSFLRLLPTILIFLSLTTSAHAWTAKVVSAIDGDTIKVLHGGKEVEVRLYGIDSPAETQSFGSKAKKVIAAYVAGKTVDVSVTGIEPSGRVVGLVTVGSKNMNRWLVEAGYAWVYDKYCKQAFCGDWKGLELRAKAAKIGLWQDVSPTPPWKWQRGNTFITGKTQRTKSKSKNLLGVGPTGKR